MDKIVFVYNYDVAEDSWELEKIDPEPNNIKNEVELSRIIQRRVIDFYKVFLLIDALKETIARDLGIKI